MLKVFLSMKLIGSKGFGRINSQNASENECKQNVYFSLDNVKSTGETGVEELILEGHLGVTKELLAFQTSEKKYHFGCEKEGLISL
ncbi:PREDICTED: probable ubiquitin carboxyl-terminal hydrolase FAF-Y, partial [Rhinopithecus bieti]|uniref:probable ubiquitin carboxyl-terminal hydrolase FAF-Y n=1 Tax=Rhinopithecus bieti TaxID=61621 RepID=UPI00083C47AB